MRPLQVWLRALRLALMLIFLGVPGEALAAAPAVEAFAALPAQTQAALSPDGHWIAWIDYRESKPRIVMFDLEARKVQRMLGVAENVDIHAIAWHNNQTLLMVL